MTKRQWLLALALGLALIGAGVGAGIAANDDATRGRATEAADEDEGADSDEGVTGADADAAGTAALEYTDRAYGAGGRVTEVETGDDGAAYGVEVLLPDGRHVEVHLDAALSVTGDEADDD